MKDIKSIKKEAAEMSDHDIKNIRALIEECNQLLENKKINEETLRKLNNLIVTFQSLKENYMWRIINSAKQNHMID
jgi:ribosomal protein L19E